MTRKDLLAARANDVVEAALSKGVCLDEAECLIVREVVLAELLRVEREVWEMVAKHLEDEAVKSLAFEHSMLRGGNTDEVSNIQSQRFAEESYAAWARTRQQELES